MEILSRRCLGDRAVAVQVLSDPAASFASGRVNFHDPNHNIALPVFTIHGNHDDPAGQDNLSAVDILSTASLVNYFGKAPIQGEGAGKVRVAPVLLQKGATRLALYGLGNLRDERLCRLFNTPNSVEWCARPVCAVPCRAVRWGGRRRSPPRHSLPPPTPARLPQGAPRAHPRRRAGRLVQRLRAAPEPRGARGGGQELRARGPPGTVPRLGGVGPRARVPCRPVGVGGGRRRLQRDAARVVGGHGALRGRGPPQALRAAGGGGRGVAHRQVPAGERAPLRLRQRHAVGAGGAGAGGLRGEWGRQARRRGKPEPEPEPCVRSARARLACTLLKTSSPHFSSFGAFAHWAHTRGRLTLPPDLCSSHSSRPDRRA